MEGRKRIVRSECKVSAGRESAGRVHYRSQSIAAVIDKLCTDKGGPEAKS